MGISRYVTVCASDEFASESRASAIREERLTTDMKDAGKGSVTERANGCFEGKEIAILSVGHMFEEAVKTRDKLIGTRIYEPTLINMRFIKPIDEAMIEKVCQTHK